VELLSSSRGADPALILLADRIRRADRLTILTGAGVSAASGVPTFRGAGGLWRQFRAEQLATAAAFAADPVLVWEWYAWRREVVGRCLPNAAHDVIARWSRQPGCTVVTQNVDDLHLLAGTERLVRLHGSLWELCCAGSVAGQRGGGQPCGAAWRDERVPLPELPPRCGCGALGRPAVVWFGEALAPDDVDAAMRGCACDVFLTVGTSAVVYPAAGLVHEAKRQGAFTAEINLDATPASGAADLAIRGAAETILPDLERLLE
jgi:NAD-dependent deacetylase